MSEYKNAEKVINRFHDSPTKFAITVLKLYWDVLKQRNQYKSERNSLIDDIDWQQKKVERLEEEKEDMLLEREYYNNRYKDTIRICKELEHENKELKQRHQTHKESADAVYEKKVKLERENEKLTNRVRKLNLNGQMHHDDLMMCDAESQSYKTLLYEFSQHIGNKPSSSTYKYFKAKLDGLGIEVGE